MNNREKAELLSDAVGLLEEKIVEEAAEKRSFEIKTVEEAAEKQPFEAKKILTSKTVSRRRNIFIPLVSLAACGAIVIGSLYLGGNKPSPIERPVYAETVAEADYPDVPQYPFDDESNSDRYNTWREYQSERYNEGQILEADALKQFSSRINESLVSAEQKNNIVYSPVNLYIAMAMLAETAEGESRSQILELAGAESMEQMRTYASALWRSTYQMDGLSEVDLANSLWINSGAEFNPDTISLLAEKYFASMYRGDPASEEITGALREWFGKHTGGLFENTEKSLSLDSDTVAALCSTIYFSAKWRYEFWEENNGITTFHGENGDADAEFMNMTLSSERLYFGEDYSAYPMLLRESGNMWLILPEEGKTVYDVLYKGEYYDMLTLPADWENADFFDVNLSVPKFDISSEIDLIGDTALGELDIFDPAKADFSALTDEKLTVNKATHAARVMIDEKGCTGAAFTDIRYANTGSGSDCEDMDFVLDRPFIFVITNDFHQPLFVGVVNNI